MLYYVYKSGTIAYMVLAIVAIANFMKKKHAFIFGTIVIAEDICTILLAYYYPVHIEQVTEINALSTTLCSFIVTMISLFLITRPRQCPAETAKGTPGSNDRAVAVCGRS